MRRLLLAVLSLTFLVAASRADTGATSAREHYERGTMLYDLGRFGEAAHEYELAYEAKHDPALLFNIAQAYRFDGKYSKALFSYKSYLRNVPDSDQRSAVEARIGELQKLLDEQKAATTNPPAGTIAPSERSIPPDSNSQQAPTTVSPTQPATTTVVRAEPTRKRPIYKTWWFWTGTAVVVGAAVGLGLGFGLSSTGPTTRVLPAVGP